jgi:OOP family OmpA-OmpF porin
VTDQIKHREPVIANVSPYTTSVTVGRGVVVLRGYAPSDDARRAVVGQATQRFAPKPIANQLDIGSGQPPGWQRCIDMAVVALHRLGNGKAELVDGRLTLTGETEAEDLAQSLPGVVREGVGGGCEVDVRVSLNLANKLKAEEEARRKAAAEEEARRRANLDREAAQRAEAEARRKAEEAARARAAEAARKQATVCVDGLRQLAREGVLLFERASSVISASSYPTLNRIAEAANKCPEVQIEIQGHTDTDGAVDRNQRLSERRAQAVVDYLVRAGVAASRMTAVGFGQDRPVAPNDTPENMARNRRIEFTVKAN